MFKFLRSSIGLALVIGFVVGLIALFTYFAASISTAPTTTIQLLPTFDITPAAPLAFERVFGEDGDGSFGRLHPALVNAVSIYGERDVVAAGVQPLGAYLPRTGNVALDWRNPTPLPTPLPYPTSPPLPLPTPRSSLPIVIPTLSPLDDNGEPRVLPYGGDACAPADLPADGILSQRFHAYHYGIDLAVPLGTPVIATHSGIVTTADWSDIGYGYLVVIENAPFSTYYAHNMSFNVQVGQQVGKGSIIAWSGSTGNSSGPHIHYEVRVDDTPLDPLTFGAFGYGSC